MDGVHTCESTRNVCVRTYFRVCVVGTKDQNDVNFLFYFLIVTEVSRYPWFSSLVHGPRKFCLFLDSLSLLIILYKCLSVLPR